ncbi:MAG: hypothetical protein H7338_02605 [Candidatus Sericytochromatia bacterium]|nr:hypothetical protein [Candidatus Sericytochromatia bacterium]
MRTSSTISFLLAGLLSGCGPAVPVVSVPNLPVQQVPVTVTPQVPAPVPPLVTAPQGPKISAGPGDFIARFVDRKKGTPIVGLEVTIINTGAKAVTDAEGKVKFDDLPANSQYQTYHNDYVQAKEKVPFSADGLDIPLLAMADHK